MEISISLTQSCDFKLNSKKQGKSEIYLKKILIE